MRISIAILLFGILSLLFGLIHEASLIKNHGSPGLILDWAFSLYTDESAVTSIHEWHQKIGWLTIYEWKVRWLLKLNSILWAIVTWVLAFEAVRTEQSSLGYSLGFVLAMLAIGIAFSIGWIAAVFAAAQLMRLKGWKMTPR